MSNLTVSENNKTSLFLKWVLPEGNATNYRVKATNDGFECVFVESPECIYLFKFTDFIFYS